jgi:hypothetical protein
MIPVSPSSLIHPKSFSRGTPYSPAGFPARKNLSYLLIDHREAAHKGCPHYQREKFTEITNTHPLMS